MAYLIANTIEYIISDGDIVGSYKGHLTGVGKVMDFLSGSMGFLLVIVLPMMLFFIYQVYNLIMISIRLKKMMAVESAKEVAAAAGDAQNAKTEAEAALEEAKRMREEAEAMRAQAAKELERAQSAAKGENEQPAQDEGEKQ